MSTSLYPPITAVERDNLTRPRAASALSHGSNRSRRSSGSGKMDLYENSRDKKRLATKADPRAAMQEAQPGMFSNRIDGPSANFIQLLWLWRTRPLRIFEGCSTKTQTEILLVSPERIDERNSADTAAVDPDRSNPTRHRLERPLDTIRSFQAAAEGTSSSRRSSYQSRPGKDEVERYRNIC